MNPAYLLLHLGLGDAIIMNGAIRRLASEKRVLIIPVKHHNLQSVAFMFRDMPNILLRPVKDDAEMLEFRKRFYSAADVIGTGSFGPNFDGRIWDQCFYNQIGLSFQDRWDMWKVERDEPSEVIKRHAPCTFVHDDESRGMVIDPIHLQFAHVIVRPHKTDHIFQWWKQIEIAPEIHCISSSFALFIDSIDLPKNPRLFMHAYCRPGEPLPTLRHNWEVIQ